jgi:hypothetical protein
LRSFSSGAQPLSGGSITNPIFFIPPTFGSGGKGARNIEIGDFNGDGRPDLVVSNQCVSDSDCSQGTVAVLLGNGDGTYQSAVASPTGAILSSLAVGDFNRDGKLDVAVDNECPDTGCTTGSINVLLGNGDGSFQAPAAYAAGGTAFSVESGDLNGDGKLDLVMANGVDSAGVFLGNGDGTFKPVSTVTTSAGGFSAVFLGDFDGDNRLDLAVVTGTCDATPTCTQSVSIHLGNGDGTFRVPTQTQSSPGLNPQAVALGDINGDGKLDLAVASSCISSCVVSESLSVFLGKGDGTFSSEKNSTAPSDDLTSLGLADLNDDGKLDLVTIDASATVAAVLLGAGDGTFDLSSGYRTEGEFPSFGALGDVNGDGRTDFAVADSCQADFTEPCTGTVVVLLGDGKGTFRAPTGYPPASNFVLTADFNGDGKPDLVAAYKLLLGNGDGTFQPPLSFDPGPVPQVVGFGVQTFGAGDFNGDGKSDLVVSGCDELCQHGSVAVLLGKGNGTFQAPLLFDPGFLPRFPVVADFNNDGKSDLAVVRTLQGSCSDLDCVDPGGISILLGKGDGTFQPPVSYLADGFLARSATVADFNGDGKLDIVVVNGNCADFNCVTGTVSVLLGNGDGTFQPQVAYSAGDFGSNSAAVGDFNGDGALDLAVANVGQCSAGLCLDRGSVGVLLGRRDGTFQPVVNYPNQIQGFTIAASDLDGDGKLDLVLSSKAVFLGIGDGTFQAEQSYNPQPHILTLFNPPDQEAVADFNGDGKPDLMVAEGSFVTELLNISSGFQHTTSTTVASSLNPANLHQRITFTATVTSPSPGVLTGTITFSDSGHALASPPVAHGKAKFSTKALAAGVHVITANYSGDEAFLSSTSPELKQAVRAETRVELSSSHNPSRRGQPVTFTAVIKSKSGGTPTGTVTFTDFSAVLANVTLSGGQATFTISFQRRGPHIIRAIYRGSSVDRRSFAVLAQRVR